MADLMTPDIREDKLPAWVRSNILELRNKIADQAATLATAREEAAANGCTGKVMADGLLTSKGFPLHDRATVRFKLPNGHVDVMLRDGGSVLDLNSSGRMSIIPNASNSVRVQTDGRF